MMHARLGLVENNGDITDLEDYGDTRPAEDTCKPCPCSTQVVQPCSHKAFSITPRFPRHLTSLIYYYHNARLITFVFWLSAANYISGN